MKSARVTSLLLVVLFAMAWMNCGHEEITRVIEDERVYSFVLYKIGAAAVSGATFSIETAKGSYIKKSDDKGKCEIRIPNSVVLPEYVIVTVDHPALRPYALSVSGTPQVRTSKSIYCDAVPGNVYIRELPLRHLGDDNYTGSENSQLQIRAQSKRWNYSFYLDRVPSTMPSFQLYARGVQHQPKIFINTTTITRLGDSDVDGDLSFYQARLTGNPASILKKGWNNFAIETIYRSDIRDWDDFEYCGLLLYK